MFQELAENFEEIQSHDLILIFVLFFKKKNYIVWSLMTDYIT